MSSSGVPSMQSTLRTVSVVPSMPSSSTAASAIGLGRTGERSAKVPRGLSQMRRHLGDQVAPSLVHPIQQEDVRVEPQIGQARGVARIEFHPAHGIRLGGIAGGIRRGS